MLISTGSKTCIYLALMALLAPGDEVLVQEPYWLSYPAQVKLAGGVPVAIPHWAKTGSFEEWFTPKTRVVILNCPNNPAGSVYSGERAPPRRGGALPPARRDADRRRGLQRLLPRRLVRLGRAARGPVPRERRDRQLALQEHGDVRVAPRVRPHERAAALRTF